MTPAFARRIAGRLRGWRLAVEHTARRRFLAATGGDVAALRGTGMRLRVDPLSAFGAELLARGERGSEDFLLPFLRACLRPGDAFVDFGAHWGTYSVAAAERVGAGGRVVAVEPYAPSRARLAANVELNHLRNVSILPCAVGPAACTGRLLVGGSGDNLNRLAPATSEAGGPPCAAGPVQACEVRTLAQLVAEAPAPRIRLAKLDVEGGEWALAADLAEQIHRFDALLVELHPRWSTPEAEQAMFASLARERVVLRFDAARRAVVRVGSWPEFREALSSYYFASIAPERLPEALDFAW